MLFTIYLPLKLFCFFFLLIFLFTCLPSLWYCINSLFIWSLCLFSLILFVFTPSYHQCIWVFTVIYVFESRMHRLHCTPLLLLFKNITLRLPNSINIVKWTEWTFTFSFFSDFWSDLIPLSKRGPQMPVQEAEWWAILFYT